MYFALSVILLALGALSIVAALRVTAGPTADQVRGFCIVGAFAAFVVVLAVLGIGLLWDGRIADAVAIVALFALVTYFLAALLVNLWPRRGTGNDQPNSRSAARAPDAAAQPSVEK